MKPLSYDVEIISAPTALGISNNSVAQLGEALLQAGLKEKLHTTHPVIHVPDLNAQRHHRRDPITNCLNPEQIRDFSLTLSDTLSATIRQQRFACVLGGDCSVLLGIMPALKQQGTYGLIFLDAHADFYEPEKSITGEVADMDLAIITGRGPEMLTNINGLCPYVKDENVIHIGQRDWEETRQYGSQDIRKTNILCYDLEEINKNGIEHTTGDVLQQLTLKQYWIHFDTDVLADDINPAVEYRLPGGLQWEQITFLLQKLLATGKIAGISITIFNPLLDHNGQIARQLTNAIGTAFTAPDF